MTQGLNKASNRLKVQDTSGSRTNQTARKLNFSGTRSLVLEVLKPNRNQTEADAAYIEFRRGDAN